jgi:hypothetical protein
MSALEGTIGAVILSIDYDKTWSADPSLWQQFARSASSRGHTVLLITNRTSAMSDEVYRNAGPYVRQVIFAGPMPKRKAAERHGYAVDVWIDDHPETVAEGLLKPTQWIFR